MGCIAKGRKNLGNNDIFSKVFVAYSIEQKVKEQLALPLLML